MTLVSEAVR